MSWRGAHGAYPLVPSALASCLRRLPAYPGSLLFAQALNLTVAPQLPLDVRGALDGKRLRLRVNDAGLCFDFGWRGQRFGALPGGAAADLDIGATLHGLWLMARRDEDPDSLFFGRRLTLEGDTELGLLFKNTMDAFDFSTLDALLRWPPAMSQLWKF
jgi:predicted lipid carrier protein YhbT